MEPDESLVAYLTDARRVLIFTGAGVSTGSGIPDYRGPQGVWRTHRPVFYDEFMSSEQARIRYWDLRLQAWEAFRDARPNAVHHAVVDLERAGRLRGVVTQNVDGLHAAAGTSSGVLVEIHGTNARVECQSCGATSQPEGAVEEFRRTRRPPSCKCGGYLKPATISFGQNLRQGDMNRAFAKAEGSDLVIALGSTLSVAPASAIPLAGAERGAPYIVINRGETDHDTHPLLTYRLEGDVAEIFPVAVRTALARDQEPS